MISSDIFRAKWLTNLLGPKSSDALYLVISVLFLYMHSSLSCFWPFFALIGRVLVFLVDDVILEPVNDVIGSFEDVFGAHNLGCHLNFSAIYGHFWLFYFILRKVVIASS